jgi:phosphoenolpyruvate carboxykinase (GTP)
MSTSDALDYASLLKLRSLDNPHVMEQVERFIALCKPDKVTVITDDPEEVSYVRNLALALGEEQTLDMEGHTIHYDGYLDQARDKEHTAVLLPEGQALSRGVNSVERESGLNEMMKLLEGSMRGRRCLSGFSVSVPLTPGLAYAPSR